MVRRSPKSERISAPWPESAGKTRAGTWSCQNSARTWSAKLGWGGMPARGICMSGLPIVTTIQPGPDDVESDQREDDQDEGADDAEDRLPHLLPPHLGEGLRQVRLALRLRRGTGAFLRHLARVGGGAHASRLGFLLERSRVLDDAASGFPEECPF